MVRMVGALVYRWLRFLMNRRSLNLQRTFGVRSNATIFVASSLARYLSVQSLKM